MILCRSLPLGKTFFQLLALPVQQTLFVTRFLLACCLDGPRLSAAAVASAVRTQPCHRGNVSRFLHQLPSSLRDDWLESLFGDWSARRAGPGHLDLHRRSDLLRPSKPTHGERLHHLASGATPQQHPQEQTQQMQEAIPELLPLLCLWLVTDPQRSAFARLASLLHQGVLSAPWLVLSQADRVSGCPDRGPACAQGGPGGGAGGCSL